jgi:phenylpropionate dioxygenase-like ring-hydroxylating dioxygenase large terminal subunit
MPTPKSLPVVPAREIDPAANLYANFPSGWFMLSLSRDLRVGEVRTKRLAGRDVVLFRTESGQAAAVDPYCPHLGAHFGHGGCVKGESIECSFHHFRFATDGKCLATGYGTPAPPKLRVASYPVHETHGLVLVWLGTAGDAPTFTIPDIDTGGWLEPAFRTYALRGHPQETSENSVDFGHLGIVHGYKEVKVLRELRTEPGHLSVQYSMVRPYVQELPRLGDLYAEFFIHVFGLGYSRVEVQVPRLGLVSRHLVFATPVDHEKLELTIGFAHHGYAEKLGNPIPRAWLHGFDRVLRRIAMRAFRHDVEQDFDIWQHKKYVHPPQLAVGDGPIGAYRRWCKQFYPLLVPPVAQADGDVAAE